jgi:oxygen-dependent protoporphyrinogen oxidase
MKQHRVVVVGAGLAGLAAAQRLAARGARVRVLERETYVGGRARSEVLEGFLVDLSAQTLWTGDRETLGLLAELGLGDDLISLAPRGREQLYRGIRRVIATHNALGIARLRGVRLYQARRVTRLARLLRRFGAALDPSAPERAAPHDDRSVADFGRLYFGETVVDRWMAPFLSSATSCDALETSRALFLRRILTHRDSAPCVLKGGLASLSEALAAEVAPTLGEEATAIEVATRSENSAGVRVRSAGREPGSPYDADAVVLALPAPEALRLAAPILASAERDFLAAIRYEPSIAFAVASATRIDRTARWIQVPHVENWPIEAIQVEIGTPGARIPEGSALTRVRATAAFSRAHLDASDREVQDRLGTMLERLYPRIRDAVLFSRVYREARAIPRFDVGHYRRLAGFLRVQNDLCARGRRVYFAADYLADPTLEGAVCSGLRTADAVERHLVGRASA